MSDTETHKTLNENRARAAVPTGRVRYILAISFVLAIVALGVIFMLFAQPGAQP